MRAFLSDFITTLSGRRQARVGALLNEATVAKDQLDRLATAIFDQFSSFAPLILAKEGGLSRTNATRVAINFRDTSVRMADLFSVTNLTSLLLDSHRAVLSSDVKAIEDELVALEKLAANYAFLLGDGKAYNYALLEPFNDERGRDLSLPVIPDRAGQGFAGTEQAVILPDQGVLVLPEQTQRHGLTGGILKGNASALLVEETDFANVYTPGSSTGWIAIVHAPGPVVKALPEAGDRVGAQVLLEFYLSQAAPASQIRVTPVADHPLELAQVTIYPGDDDSQGVALLDQFRPLDRAYTVHFPMRTVARFRILLNQPTYERSLREANQVEDETRRILREVQNRRQRGRVSRETIRSEADRVRKQRLAQLVRTLGQDETDDRSARSSLPSLPGVEGSLRSDYLIRVLQMKSRDASAWGRVTAFSDAMQRMVPKVIPELNDFFARGWRERQSFNPDPGSPDVFVTPEPPRPLVPSGYEYRYHLGLTNVSIGADAPGFKGVFVSNPLDAPGDIGAIRLKTNETNYVLPGQTRDSNKVTSVEYSVSHRHDPLQESDWTPILPVGASAVAAERLFPDNAGRGYLRFPASPTGTIHLYRNGYEVPIRPEQYLLSPSGAVAGISLQSASYSPEDILTVDYLPVGDSTVVSFEAESFATQVPLVATFDEQGAGEGYVTTVGRNEIDLVHVPYVDPKQVATSGYSQSLGLNPYQPVIVQLSTGGIAINLTNYGVGTQAELPDATTGYYYLHAGRTLTFNRNIENFRVFYQYLQSSTRFRVVLRVNDKNFVSPSVDFVHAKAKTRRPDAASA